jgi:hypothetical protein
VNDNEASLIAALTGIVAPKITTIGADDDTPAVGQQVTVTGAFSTFLSAAAPVSSALPLDDVAITTSGVSGAVASVDNAARTFTVTFTPSAAGPATLAVTLTYNAPLSALAGTPLAPLTFGTDSVSVTAAVANQAPVANAGPDQNGVYELTQVTLSGSATDDGKPSPLTYQWTQYAGPHVALASPTSAVTTFVAPDVEDVVTLKFNLTVSDGALTDRDNVSIQVRRTTDVAGVGVNDSTTTLSLDSSAFVVPAAGTASASDITAVLSDRNGVQQLDNSLLLSRLTGPQDLDESLDFAAVTDSSRPGDQSPTLRAFRYDLDFPARLQDGTYQFATTYNGNGPATRSFDVANVAPTLAMGARVDETFTAGHGAFVTDPVTLTLDDANWGGFGDTPVTELKHLTLSGIPSGMVLQISDDAGATWANVTGPTYDLSDVENGTGAYVLQVRLASPTGVVPAGNRNVTAVLSDQLDAASATRTLFGLTIRPENFGFYFGVNDGGDGISLRDVDPGNRTTSEDDPVAVSFTGTFDADALVVTIGRFSCTPASASCNDSFGPYNSNPAYSAKVRLHGQADLSDDPVEAPVDPTGAAGFDLASIRQDTPGFATAGSAVYVVLDIFVPGGIDAGHYIGAVNVDVTGDAS